MFFQNPFDQEFRQSLPFGDRQYSLTFAIPANPNQSTSMMTWKIEPYDLSVVNTLTLNFAIDKDFKNYAAIAVNVAGNTPAATLAFEVVNLLNADTSFTAWFTAHVADAGKNNAGNRVLIKAKLPKQDMRVYINNAGAEQSLGFNVKAPVAELPSYCVRHTIANRFTYEDGVSTLIELDPNDAVDQAVITAAGLDYASPKADWQLLAGRVGLFNFKKITVDGSDRITQIIEYSAGAAVGHLARKTNYTYTSSNKNPDKITEVPYTLASGDLVTP